MSRLEQTNESERCLLAAVMAAPETIVAASAVVDASDFIDDPHRRLWGILEAMTEARESIRDRRRLINNIRQAGLLDSLGGAGEFARHYVDSGTGANVMVYAREVKQHATRRRLAAIAEQFQQDIETTDDPAQLADETRAKIDAAAIDTGNASHCVTLHEAAIEQLALIENPQASELGSLLSSGLDCFDETYGGFRSGGSYVIAARPGNGKSALMKQIANSLDERAKPALLVSMEMEPREIAARILAERTEIDGKFFEVDERGETQLNSADIDRLRGAVDDAQHSVLHISAPTGRAATMEAIAGHARLMKVKHGIRLLAVDYLQIMAKSSSRQTDYEFVTANSKAFKQLARELGIVVLLLSQLNRETERGTKPRRPRLSDLRDSGAIEQDADGVILLHRIEEHKPDFELIVAKIRNDSPATFNVRLIGEQTKFSPQPIESHPNYNSAFSEWGG